MCIKVVPVMDVMNGVVVHAVAGRRREYKPLGSSVVASSPNPLDVLRGFKKLGCDTIYIADLDSIEGTGDNWFVIEEAVKMGFKVMADIGRRGILRSDSSVVSYVIGTEYLVYPDELGVVVNRFISIDMKSGRVVFRNSSVALVNVVKEVCNRNPKKVIVLNLDIVGTERGLDIESVRVVKEFCRCDIAVGGGLRSVEELYLLKNIGVKEVLVATAIHRGVVTKCIY